MVSRRQRAKQTLGAQISKLSNETDGLKKEVSGSPGTDSILEENLSENSVGPRALQPNSVTSEAMARGAVGTENLGIVNALTSDGPLSLAVPTGNVVISGTEYVVPAAETRSLSIDEDGNVVTSGAATTTYAGPVELATDAETQTGTATDRAITPANLSARTSTTTRTGVVELATDAEVTTGTDTSRAVTPAGLVTGLARSGGMRYVDTVYFTSSGTFEKATYPWLRGVRVFVQGAGGAGGGASAPGAGNHSAGSGGGGGGMTEIFITNIAGLPSSVTVTIGAGGTGVSGAAGNAGGDSSWNTTVIGGGGGGGGSANNSALAISALPGTGGSGSGGDITHEGSSGTMAGGNATLGVGGSGGSAWFGGGAPGTYTGAGSGGQVGQGGLGAGGGGSGAMSNANGSARLGGAGAPGVVIVELYA